MRSLIEKMSDIVLLIYIKDNISIILCWNSLCTEVFHREKNGNKFKIGYHKKKI